MLVDRARRIDLLNAGTGEHQPRIARQCGVLAGHVAAIGRKGMGTVAVAHPFDQHRQTLERRLIGGAFPCRSEEHTSELQSLMRISYAVFCLKKKTTNNSHKTK